MTSNRPAAFRSNQNAPTLAIVDSWEPEETIKKNFEHGAVQRYERAT